MPGRVLLFYVYLPEISEDSSRENADSLMENADSSIGNEDSSIVKLQQTCSGEQLLVGLT